ncbi:patatin-like phospholipase family protein [Rhodobacter sp. NSM]|uniref:patatin-like phospholipase family protein n=1 Tax=Rhodobacter sp. NSM TaxID=3457501 RepID=UPI003FD554DA
MDSASPTERKVLVLQGGGAMGAYQAGAYEVLAEQGLEPDWIAGISIGAINAALIAGNRPEDRVPHLREFWETVSSGSPRIEPTTLLRRQLVNSFSGLWVQMFGATGFFRPRPFPPALMPDGTPEALSWYDTTPLAATLARLIDESYLSEKRGPRLSVGAVAVATGNFTYFDSAGADARDVGIAHAMASGALPPGFAPVEIDGQLYWDGGLVSNTPLQHVLENTDGAPLCIFQLDLFPARGPEPRTIYDVHLRAQDIRYSSRTRLTTDRYRQLAEIRAAGLRLRQKVGDELKDDPDLRFLTGMGATSPVTLAHLINRGAAFEGHTKDYEFSRRTMLDHWAAGAADMRRLLASPEWRGRIPARPGLTVIDPDNPSGAKRYQTAPA